MFLFYLARELGMTVKEIEENMSASEFQEWAAYFKIISTERGE